MIESIELIISHESSLTSRNTDILVRICSRAGVAVRVIIYLWEIWKQNFDVTFYIHIRIRIHASYCEHRFFPGLNDATSGEGVHKK